MRMAYNILFALFFWLSAPWYFLKLWRRGNWRAGFGQRFARYGADLQAAAGQRPVIWLHAVSVGEVGVCLHLIRALEPRLAGFQIIVSTTTSTGMGELRRRLPPHIRAVLLSGGFSRRRAPGAEQHPAAGHHIGRGGIVAQSALAGAGARHPPVPGQRPALRTLVQELRRALPFCSGPSSPDSAPSAASKRRTPNAWLRWAFPPGPCAWWGT